MITYCTDFVLTNIDMLNIYIYKYEHMYRVYVWKVNE